MQTHSRLARALSYGAIALGLALIWVGLARAEAPPPSLPAVASITTLLPSHAKTVDWCATNDLIAHGRWGSDGYVDVWVMRPDGSHARCLTSKSGLCPQRHNGNPTWHPSGKWLVFTVQNQDAGLGEASLSGRGRSLSVPGSGLNCNLWAVNTEGTKAFQLTFNATSYEAPKGVLHPQFSPDGKQVFWAGPTGEYEEGVTWGKWALYLADWVVEDGTPHFENIKELRPGAQQHFYETHGFSPDGTQALFCANCEPDQPVTGLDIYRMDLASGDITNLTNTLGDWDEHAHYSPDGRWIVWLSSTGMTLDFKQVASHAWQRYIASDLWVMDAETGQKQRLTFFNEPGHPDYTGVRTVVADSAWSPDGKSLVVLVTYAGGIEATLGLTSRLVMVRLDLPEATE